MTDLLTRGLVQILRSDSTIAGTGFLVSPRWAVTCTHVLVEAGASIGAAVSVRLYGAAAPQQADIDPDYWRPADAEDVAFLQLTPPAAERPALPLGSSNGTNGHEFETFGFPSINAAGGIRGDGHILGKTTINGIPVLQIDTKQVSPGFSGAPVWDKMTGRVVGMVTRIAVPDEYGRLKDIAFIVPSESLRGIFAGLSIQDSCPYRGLSSFTSDPEDVKVFCGRSQLTSDLIAQLRRNPSFLAVVGPSGSGKSSVVNAGLIPALQSKSAGFSVDDLRIFPLSKVTTDDVMAALREVPLDGKGNRTRNPPLDRTVFILDELEQFFVASSKASESVLPSLERLIKVRPSFSLVVTFRSDFYEAVLKSALGSSLNLGQVNVSPMGLSDLKQAIERPAASVGLTFSDGLVDDIAAEASKLDNPLPLLEFALTQLWERREDGELTRKAYRDIGGVAGSVGFWATDALATLTEAERKTAKRIFTRLIHYGDGRTPDTRKRATLPELISISDDLNQVLSVVMKLATARLLTTDRDLATQQQTIGLIHDALISHWSQLESWLREERDFLLWRQRLGFRLEEWEKGSRDSGALIRGQALDEALRWQVERGEELTSRELSFVDAALEVRRSEETARKEQEEQKARSASRLRIVIATAVVASIIAVLLLIGFAITEAIQLRRITEERDHARRERDRADRITQFMTGMFKVSNPSESRGNTVTAREILDKASKDIDSELGSDPELQAKMIYTMGNTYISLGLYTRAQPLIERAIVIQKRALGSENPETLRSINALAWLLNDEGHYAEAEKLQRETLGIQRRVLGPEHPDTLRSMHNLAVDLKLEGHYAEAEKLHRETLDIRRRVLGSEHPETLDSMNNLALDLYGEGRFAEAEKLDRETLDVRHRTLGPEHPDTLDSMNNLALDVLSEGRYAEAEKLNRETLDLKRRVLGPEHPETLNSMNNLALNLLSEGRYAEAEKLNRETLDLKRRVLGPEHPETAVSIYNLACTMARLNRSDEAVSLLREAMEHGLPGYADLGMDKDPDLESLHGDPRFEALVAKARQVANAKMR